MRSDRIFYKSSVNIERNKNDVMLYFILWDFKKIFELTCVTNNFNPIIEDICVSYKAHSKYF